MAVTPSRPLALDPTQRTLIAAHPGSATRWLVRAIQQHYPGHRIHQNDRWHDQSPADSVIVSQFLRTKRGPSRYPDIEYIDGLAPEGFDRIIGWVREPIRVVYSYATVAPPEPRETYPPMRVTLGHSRLLNSLRIVTEFYAWLAQSGYEFYRLEDAGEWAPRDEHHAHGGKEPDWLELGELDQEDAEILWDVSQELGYHD